MARHRPKNQDKRPKGPPRKDRGQDSPALTAIPSPYYFVPVADEVWYPEDRVSHDVPFSDGLCGRLEFEVEAKRPLYIRGTAERPKELPEKFDPERPGKFREVIEKWTAPYSLDGVPAIPGSSLRGMIRGVLKILTSGSIRHADNTAISMRDLQLPAYREHMTETIPQQRRSYSPWTEAAWMRETESGEWQIVRCEHSRVEHDLIEKHLQVRDLRKRQKLAEKYKRLGGEAPRAVKFHSDGERALHDHSRGNRLKYDKVRRLGEGKPGSLVVTGQPGGTKRMEFVFHTPSLAEIPGKREVEVVSEQVREDFLATHQPNGVPVESWEFWKKKLKKGEWIPVFHLADEGVIWALGLAQMFRIAGTSRVHDGIPEDHFRDRPDFTDLIFGKVGGKAGESLAGRVSFGHARCSNGCEPVTDQLWTVLGNPRPSFYPNYLAQRSRPGTPDKLTNSQNGKGVYTTWLSSEIRIRGWKRYAIHPDVGPEDEGALRVPKPPGGNYSAATAFRPLPSGARFKGILHFHNLRPHELGALAWVLTWGGDGSLRHALGMAKPLGFGSVRIGVAEASFTDMSGEVHTLDDCVKAFETALEEACPGWKESPAIKELMALADPRCASQVAADLLGYPEFNSKQFQKSKGSQGNDQLVLPDYRARIGARNENIAQKNVPARRAATESATQGGTSVAPAMETVPEPEGPKPLRMGEEHEGEILQVAKRLKFLPDGHPKAAAGNIIHPPEGLAAGRRARAKVDWPSSAGNTFKGLELLD